MLSSKDWLGNAKLLAAQIYSHQRYAVCGLELISIWLSITAPTARESPFNFFPPNKTESSRINDEDIQKPESQSRDCPRNPLQAPQENHHPQ